MIIIDSGSFVFITSVLLCLLVCNLLFFLFRAYQNSLPYPHPQHLIINVLFSYLSIIWQISNLLSGISLILPIFLEDYESSPVICVIKHLRYIQIYSSTICLFLVSFARFFAHFWSEAYLTLNHSRLSSLSLGILLIFSLVPNILVVYSCESLNDWPKNRVCADAATQMLVEILIPPIYVLNVAILCSMFKKNRAVFSKLFEGSASHKLSLTAVSFH